MFEYGKELVGWMERPGGAVDEDDEGVCQQQRDLTWQKPRQRACGAGYRPTDQEGWARAENQMNQIQTK